MYTIFSSDSRWQTIANVPRSILQPAILWSEHHYHYLTKIKAMSYIEIAKWGSLMRRHIILPNIAYMIYFSDYIYILGSLSICLCMWLPYIGISMHKIILLWPFHLAKLVYATIYLWGVSKCHRGFCQSTCIDLKNVLESTSNSNHSPWRFNRDGKFRDTEITTRSTV